MSALVRALQSKNSVRGATGILVVTLTLSNLLGLLRDRLLAAKIPADVLDSYFAAFRLPDLLTNLIVVGAIAVAFIPVFTELRTKDEATAWRAATTILNVLIIILVVGSLFLWLFMPELMALVVPEFEPTKLATTITLARWLSLTPVLFGISYLLSGILNSLHRFVVYAFAPLVYNLAIIGATLLLVDGVTMSGRVVGQLGVQGVVLGVLGGAFLHMAIQLPVAFRLGWRWQPLLSWTDPAVKKIGTLMVPRIIGLLGMQLATLVATALASAWAGAITYFNFANNIQTMPTVVFANSIATAVFPTLAAQAARHDDVGFRTQLIQGIRWILFLLVPATVGLILLRIQIVRIVLGAGFFDWEATQVTADVLGWFAIALVASGLVPLLARAFYARQDTQTPMVFAIISSLLTIGLSYLLVAILPPLVHLTPTYLLHVGEVAALAIAASLGMFINAGLLLVAIDRHLALPWRQLLASLLRILIATLVMAAAVQIAKMVMGTVLGLDRFLEVLAQAAIATLIGVGSYALTARFLGCPEWYEVISLVKKKLSTPNSTGPVL